MRPLRTAVTTAALRRTTQRLVFGGGRSSLIARAPSDDRASARYSSGPPGPWRPRTRVRAPTAAAGGPDCVTPAKRHSAARSADPGAAWVGRAERLGVA